MDTELKAGGRFEDEWLVRAVTVRLGVDPEAVARLRAAGRKHLAEACSRRGSRPGTT